MVLNPSCLSTALPHIEERLRDALEAEGIPFRMISGPCDDLRGSCKDSDPEYVSIYVSGQWRRREVKIYFSRGFLCAWGEKIDAVWDGDKWLPEYYYLVTDNEPSNYRLNSPVGPVTGHAGARPAPVPPAG